MLVVLFAVLSVAASVAGYAFERVHEGGPGGIRALLQPDGSVFWAAAAKREQFPHIEYHSLVVDWAAGVTMTVAESPALCKPWLCGHQTPRKNIPSLSMGASASCSLVRCLEQPWLDPNVTSVRLSATLEIPRNASKRGTELDSLQPGELRLDMQFTGEPREVGYLSSHFVLIRMGSLTGTRRRPNDWFMDSLALNFNRFPWPLLTWTTYDQTKSLWEQGSPHNLSFSDGGLRSMLQSHIPMQLGPRQWKELRWTRVAFHHTSVDELEGMAFDTFSAWKVRFISPDRSLQDPAEFTRANVSVAIVDMDTVPFPLYTSVSLVSAVLVRFDWLPMTAASRIHLPSIVLHVRDGQLTTGNINAMAAFVAIVIASICISIFLLWLLRGFCPCCHRVKRRQFHQFAVNAPPPRRCCSCGTEPIRPVSEVSVEAVRTPRLP
jgi:hypothetical protein